MEETLQENESAAAGGVNETIPALSPKKSSVAKLIRQMWPAYLIEIIVIILGISITLALEEWRDSQKENRLEQVYLKNLMTDVEVDLQSIKLVSVSTKNIIHHGNNLVEIARMAKVKGKTIDTGATRRKINVDVRTILGRPKFYSSDVTFSDLKSSGNLHLLKDIKLKNLLFAYYSQVEYIKEMQDAEQQATIVISGDYFLKRFSMDDTDTLTPLFNKNNATNYLQITGVEFDNNVLLRLLTRRELLDDYQRADSIGVRLKNELKKRID